MKLPVPLGMQVQKVPWGGLTSYLAHDLPAGQSPSLAVVLCHGFGAPGTDLVGLAQPLLTMQAALGQRVAFLFPAALLDLAERGMQGGRAWWWVDLERLIYGRTPDVLDHFRRACPPELPAARAALTALLTDAGKHFGLTTDRFVLGGFSQGAMLAIDVALRLPAAPASLCVFSGGLINEEEWRTLARSRSGLVVLQSHGRQDSILPFPLAAALRDLLLEGGAKVDFLAFNGDHEIPMIALERMARLLAEVANGGEKH
jgi:phospholipase/carboxylesterase